MGTQPDWRADPTLSMPTPPPADPWSDHPLPPHSPQPGYIPGPPVPGYVPPGPGRPGRPGATRPDRTQAELTRPEPWRGAAAVHPPKPAPAPDITATAVDAPAPSDLRSKSRVKPYLTPGLPQPKAFKAWKQGGGWSLWGAFFAFCCWGTWAISRRGSLPAWFLLGTLPVIAAVGVMTFLVSRMLGKILMDSWRSQPRKTAKVAHFITFVYFILVGIGYLRMTTWIIDGLNWLDTLR